MLSGTGIENDEDDDVTNADTLTVVKVFNNSVLLCADSAGRDRIALGRGIGFAARPGQALDVAAVHRFFSPLDATLPSRLADLIADLPPADVEASFETVEEVRRRFGDAVADRFCLPFTDHLCFALARARQQLEITYPLAGEVALAHPDEVHFARLALDRVQASAGQALPDLEAIPIALHLVNAQLGTRSVSDTLELTRSMAAALDHLAAHVGRPLDPTARPVARFLAHLRFALTRPSAALGGAAAVTDAGVDRMAAALARSNPSEYACARALQNLLNTRFGLRLHEEDVVYLAVHLVRLTAKVGLPTD